MKRWLYIFVALALVACGSPVPSVLVTGSYYPDLGAAPELSGDVWLNTSAPLRLANLRGKVVLLDMWTFDCINCRDVIPTLRDWNEKYGPQGLVVIGNHYPEFPYERSLANLKKAVVDLNVPYPVVQDNEGLNLHAYRSLYWPTLYLIDKQGRLRYTRIGEGGYAEISRRSRRSSASQRRKREAVPKHPPVVSKIRFAFLPRQPRTKFEAIQRLARI
jgi:thiol-disulfide isomerase/thioredoxin